MQIAAKTKERSTVILAVLTIVVVGLSLLMSTLQTFRHQSDAEEQHLFLTTRAVFLAIESSVRRNPVNVGENRLSPRTAEFFQALEQDGDVLFVGILDALGGNLLTAPLHGSVPITLPQHMVDEMLEQGEWHGRLSLGEYSAYVYGKRLEPLRGMHMSLRDDFGPPGVLVIGVNIEQYLNASRGFRQNVLLQGAYILCAAMFTLLVGRRFLSRREQASRAVALELFQAKLLDNLPDGLITLTADGMIRSANRAALSILKRNAREVLGRPASELPPGIAPVIVSKAEGEQPEAVPEWRHVAYAKAHLEVLALPQDNDRENAWMLIIRDRTTLRNLEKSLADAEKLAAVGTLAAGVAHEVRNPLSSLRGFAQYFVKKLAGRVPEEEYAKTMVREADRLNRVITDLLFLARPKPIAPQQVVLEQLLREISLLLRFDLERRKMSIVCALEAPRLFADEEALKQALLNLLINSMDAVEAANTQNASAQALPPPSLSVASGCVSGGIWIEVRDNGCGMTAEQYAQAFEPFFTAKKHGTGLGLALVQRIMLAHSGSAMIRSEPGQGCAVRLFFPNEQAAGC